jgi:RHS repeat-associated protein
VAWAASGENDTATYSYIPNSDLLYQLSTTSGLATTYAYEADRNLKTQVKNEFNAQLISQYDYNYNNLALRDHMQTSGSAFTGTPIEPTPETSTYTTNSLNQYTQITKDNGQQTIDTLTYDDDGNLASIASGSSNKLYKYNAENRLIAVEPSTPINGDKKVEFVYDYMGRRIQKKVYTYVSDLWSLSSDTLFFYDGWNLILEMDGTGSVHKSYVYGLDLSQSVDGAGGVGGLISVVDTGEVYHFIYDSNGNVGQLVDADSGSIVAQYEYNPFGILLNSYGAMKKDVNPFRFSTKYYDMETGLYYYGYRYYSTNLGRWISRDPIEEEGGLNLYAFVLNDPLNYFDLLGLQQPAPEIYPQPTPKKPPLRIVPKRPVPVVTPSSSWIKWGTFWTAFIAAMVESPVADAPGLDNVPFPRPIPNNKNEDKKCCKERNPTWPFCREPVSPSPGWETQRAIDDGRIPTYPGFNGPYVSGCEWKAKAWGCPGKSPGDFIQCKISYFSGSTNKVSVFYYTILGCKCCCAETDVEKDYHLFRHMSGGAKNLQPVH